MADRKLITIPGLNISLFQKEKSPNIYYYFTINKTVFKGTTKTSDLKQAQTIAINKFIDIRDNDGKEKQNYTFTEVVEQFLKFKSKNVVKGTMVRYNIASNYLIEYFGKYQTEEINSALMLKYTNWRQSYYDRNPDKLKGKKSGGVSFTDLHHTINLELTLLKSIILFAIDYLQVKTSVPKFKKLSQKRREHILSKKEYALLMDYLSMGKGGCFYVSICRFLSNTGLRFPLEIMNLKWKSVYLDKNYITVVGKGNKTRSVPLFTTAKKILLKLREREGIPIGDDDYVFLNDNGKQIKRFDVRWNNALNDLNINKGIKVYSFRHLFATKLLKRPTISVKFIADIMGHESLEMIQKYYGHLKIQDHINVVFATEKSKEEYIQKKMEEDALKVRLDAEMWQEELCRTVFGK